MTISIPFPMFSSFKVRHLFPFMNEIDALKRKVEILQKQLEDIYSDPYLHEKIASKIAVDDIEIDYGDLSNHIDYGQLADYISYSELEDEIHYDSVAEEINTDKLDIDAIGDALVGNIELTERVGRYLTKMSLRFQRN